MRIFFLLETWGTAPFMYWIIEQAFHLKCSITVNRIWIQDLAWAGPTTITFKAIVSALFSNEWISNIFVLLQNRVLSGPRQLRFFNVSHLLLLARIYYSINGANFRYCQTSGTDLKLELTSEYSEDLPHNRRLYKRAPARPAKVT